jgi:hypothetical protein
LPDIKLLAFSDASAVVRLFSDRPALFHQANLNYAILRIARHRIWFQISIMTWKTMRLELARTPEYPNGSSAHAYVFRVPLDDDGYIDPVALREAEKRPVVRRFWPGEPDQNGVVISNEKGWAFSYKVGDDDDELIFGLQNHPIQIGEYLTITETDGSELPFKVVSCRE